MQSIKLDWHRDKKAKNTSNAKTKTRRREREREGESREREKVTKSLGAFFFPHLGKIFPFSKPWSGN